MKQILSFVLFLTFVNAIFGQVSNSISPSASISVSTSLSSSWSISLSSSWSTSLSSSWSTSLSNTWSISQSWTPTVSITQSWTSSVSITQSWTMTGTFSRTSNCGNGVLNSPEQCDNGSNSGSATSCCTAQCTYKRKNAVCGTRKGDCYKKPVCNAIGVCMSSVMKTSGVACKNQKTGTTGICKGATCVPASKSPKAKASPSKKGKAKSKSPAKKAAKSKSKKSNKGKVQE